MSSGQRSCSNQSKETLQLRGGRTPYFPGYQKALTKLTEPLATVLAMRRSAQGTGWPAGALERTFALVTGSGRPWLAETGPL
jgi:hypothetical protein